MTGSGKSTVMNLIPRFYDVTKGAIRIDGRDVRNFTLKSLRNHIGIVFQESTLFAGTIRENIAYAKPNAPLEAVIEVAKTAQIHDFISSLPDGYETIVGEKAWVIWWTKTTDCDRADFTYRLQYLIWMIVPLRLMPKLPAKSKPH